MGAGPVYAVCGPSDGTCRALSGRRHRSRSCRRRTALVWRDTRQQPAPARRRGSGSGRLDLARFVERAVRQPAAPAGHAGGLIQPGHREPAHTAHRREGAPDGPVEQPLRPVRRAIPRTLGDRPPIPSAQVAHHRGGVLARLQPRLGPREARPQQFQQLGTFRRPRRCLSWRQQPPSVLLSSQTHDRQAAAPWKTASRPGCSSQCLADVGGQVPVGRQELVPPRLAVAEFPPGEVGGEVFDVDLVPGSVLGEQVHRHTP
jgi:hypothetical protein